MREWIIGAGNVAVLIVTVGLVGVWITYGLLFRWSKRKAGKAFYIFLTSLVLVIVTGLASRTLPPEVFGEDTLQRAIVRLGVYLYIGYAVGWIIYGLIYNWRRAGDVLDLESRAAKARAALDGNPAPNTEEIDIP